MPYIIYDADYRRPIIGHDGRPLRYDNQDAANSAALQVLNNYKGFGQAESITVQVRDEATGAVIRSFASQVSR